MRPQRLPLPPRLPRLPRPLRLRPSSVPSTKASLSPYKQS